MIGANNSPLSMFTGQSPNGPSMYQIGYNSGPGGTANAALLATIDRYHANLDAQQQQSIKLAQIDAESGAGLKKEEALTDYKSTADKNKVDAINAANNSLPNGGVDEVNLDGRKIFLKKQLDNSGVMTTNNVQPTPSMTFEQLIAQSAQNTAAKQPQNGIVPIPGVPAAAPILQGSNGAVADTTGAQAPIRVKVNANGQTGTIPANEYDPSIYTRI